MAKESSAWKKKWNPGLRVARCCYNCAYKGLKGGVLTEFCCISPASNHLNHPRGSSETCDNWKAADWAKERYGDRLK